MDTNQESVINPFQCTEGNLEKNQKQDVSLPKIALSEGRKIVKELAQDVKQSVVHHVAQGTAYALNAIRRNIRRDTRLKQQQVQQQVELQSQQVDRFIEPELQSQQVDRFIEPELQSQQVARFIEPESQSQQVDRFIEPELQYGSNGTTIVSDTDASDTASLPKKIESFPNRVLDSVDPSEYASETTSSFKKL